MLMCNETVTLVQYDEITDAYRCTVLEGVSWHAKTAIVNTAQGVTTANVLKSRIPADRLPEGVTLCKESFLVRGIVAEVKTLDELTGREMFCVTAIGDNRRGHNPHWVVSGA